ncbi:MAG: thiolase domain-containing protein [Caldilineales bacterium]|nr:thiolase domain-containing protein [Caldilineales bacterium]
MRAVSIVGIGQIPVRKRHEGSLRVLGARVVRQAMADAGIERVDALYAGNMLSDELQSQKHIASLVADEAGLSGVEALQIRAATASGAAALRMAYLAVASGEADSAIAMGVEKMSDSPPTQPLAKALDAEKEVPDGKTLISQNAMLMQMYMDRYAAPREAFAHFAVNAHANALHNPNALFGDKAVTVAEVMASRIISPPIRLFDCSPICDGAAAALLVPATQAHHYTDRPVRLLASSVATDRFRIDDRPEPLILRASQLSMEKALVRAGIQRHDISFFEVHDAFTIMACLLLEAAGFVPPGQGWRMAMDGAFGLNGELPITTMGGLKARGHPIGATALYQTCEICLQLTGRAGANQLPHPQTALLQSVGGAAATVLTHIFGV